MKVPHDKLRKVTVAGVFAHAITTSKGPGFEYRNTKGEPCDENGILDSDKETQEVSEQKPDEQKPDEQKPNP
jgi:hypothetical protein